MVKVVKVAERRREGRGRGKAVREEELGVGEGIADRPASAPWRAGAAGRRSRAH